MKKAVTIFFLIAYLFSATDLKELLKLEVVIEHLHEHQRSDNSITLIQFLVMHYVTDDHNDKDNDRDNQLPFKSPDNQFSNLSFIQINNPFSTISFQSFISQADNFFPAYDSYVPSSFQTLVWHPPQIS